MAAYQGHCRSYYTFLRSIFIQSSNSGIINLTKKERMKKHEHKVSCRQSSVNTRFSGRRLLGQCFMSQTANLTPCLFQVTHYPNTQLHLSIAFACGGTHSSCQRVKRVRSGEDQTRSLRKCYCSVFGFWLAKTMIPSDSSANKTRSSFGDQSIVDSPISLLLLSEWLPGINPNSYDKCFGTDVINGGKEMFRCLNFRKLE